MSLQSSADDAAATRSRTDAPRTGADALPGTFIVLGAAFVVLGGLVAAVTRPLSLDQGSWAAAYLVLVWGSYQFVMGKAQQLLPSTPPPRRLAWGQLLSWNTGSAGVVLGATNQLPLLVDLSGLLLVFVLVSALWVVRKSDRTALSWTYRAVTVLLILSVPIGSVLAHTNAT